MTRPPLSMLDLAVVSDGSTSAQALAGTTLVAQAADRAGYHRFWVAEHHNMPSVASTTPPVLIAHLAASTERIRVGSGGVMLPNHAPLVVAEQFAMLEALHPGRIDLGIGRAPGTDQETAVALRRSPTALGAEDFPRHLLDLMALVGDVRTAEGLWTRFRATPVAGSSPQVLLLGSTDYSAQLAGILGLPFAFAHHFDMGGTQPAVAAYRKRFEPSPALDRSHLIVSANVLVADTEAEAQRLAAPGQVMLLARRTGRFLPILSPDDAAAHPDIDEARAQRSNRIVGTAEQAVTALEDLARETGADELMISTVAHAPGERVRSVELLAAAWAA